MDVRVLIRKYKGKTSFNDWNIDKGAITGGEEKINNEIRTKFPLMEEGGYIPSVDHSIPSDVPFKNYLYYVTCLKNYILKKWEGKCG